MENEEMKKLNIKSFFNAIQRSHMPLVFYFCFLIITYILGYYVGSSLSLALIVLQTLGAMALVLIYQKNINFTSFIMFFIILVFFAISYFTHFTGMEYLCNTVKLSCILLICPSIKLSKKEIGVCISLLIFYSVLIMFLAPHGDAHMETEDFIHAVLPYNPNTSGFILSLFAMCLLLGASKFKKITNALLFAFVILLFGFLFVFKSRTAMAGFILFVIAYLFCKYILKLKPNLYGFLALLACVGGILFAYVYIVLFNELGYGKLTIFGKDLFTGRQYIWMDAFEQLKGHYLFGIGNTLHSSQIGNDTSGVTNLHNQMMGFLTVFGVFSFSAFALFIARQVKLLAQKRKKRIGSILFIFVLIAMSYFDTILYSSANSAIICGVIILISALENLEKIPMPLRKELKN